jgi:hypothetical protein
MYPVRKLIVSGYPVPKGCSANQSAPFRGGVNELIIRMK